MVLNSRVRFPLIFMLALVVTSSTASLSQVQGVPPSVPSLGFRGNTNPAFGVGATSLKPGPNGNGTLSPSGCCANYFLPSGFSPFGPIMFHPPAGHRHHHPDQHHAPIGGPTYVPYAVFYGVPYALDSDDDTGDGSDPEYPISSPEVATKRGRNSGRTTDRDSGDGSGFSAIPDSNLNGDDSASDVATPEKSDEPSVVEPPVVEPQIVEPVKAQPATVLVFTDGHRSDVVNYAIIGDTLFDFAEGRTRKVPLADLDLAATRKANDDQGVEFKLPPASEATGTSK